LALSYLRLAADALMPMTSDISASSDAAEPGTPNDNIAILQVSSLALSSSRQTLSKIRFVDLPFESRKKYL